jgi:hypothetical protein
MCWPMGGGMFRLISDIGFSISDLLLAAILHEGFLCNATYQQKKIPA